MKNSIQYTLILSLILTFMSCDKGFKDLNKDPFESTETDIGPLFNNVISSLRLGWNEQFYVHNEVLYKQTQLAALTTEAWSNLSIGSEEIWTNYYRALAHSRNIDKRLDEKEDDFDIASINNIRAMLKIIMAYKTFRLTDLFGDIPYTQAGRGFESLEYIRPEFDTQEDIYHELLGDLKWASENLSDTVSSEFFNKFISFDNFMFGDLSKWRKFANSLRLRHAMRMADKDFAYASAIIEDIMGNELPLIVGYNLTSPVLEYIGVSPKDLSFFNESAHWSFREHKNLRMGSTIWNMMSVHDSTDGSGIFDARAYVYFETNNNNEWAAFPQIPNAGTAPSGGIPYLGARDNNYTLKGEACIYSPFNYYLIRDPQDIPELIITGAEVHFLKAEAYLRGIGVPPDETMASNEFMSGIMSSVDFWKRIANNSGIWANNNIPASLSSFNVVNNFAFWNVTTDEEKLALIYAQRWIDLFRQPWEAYALTRRTGRTPREGNAINHFRLPYPPSELENNPENIATAISMQGGDSPENKIWWISN